MNVSLRPIETADLDRFRNNFADGEGTGDFQWFGHASSATVVAALAERSLLRGEFNMLAVLNEGHLVGRVEWFKKAWGRPETSWCWEIAIGLFREARGLGIGTAAQSELAGYLFQHTTAQRLQATTDIHNLAERRALERCGFLLEGILRSAQWRNGGWHDLAMYSRLRAAQQHCTGVVSTPGSAIQ